MNTFSASLAAGAGIAAALLVGGGSGHELADVPRTVARTATDGGPAWPFVTAADQSGHDVPVSPR